MKFFRQVFDYGIAQALEVYFIAERYDNKRHEHLFRADDDLFVWMVGVYPEGGEGLNRVEDLAASYAGLSYFDMNILRRTIDEKGQREGREENENAQNDVAEDKGDERKAYSNDARSPEPVCGTLFVLVVMSLPLECEGRFSHDKIVARPTSKQSGGGEIRTHDGIYPMPHFKCGALNLSSHSSASPRSHVH